MPLNEKPDKSAFDVAGLKARDVRYIYAETPLEIEDPVVFLQRIELDIDFPKHSNNLAQAWLRDAAIMELEAKMLEFFGTPIIPMQVDVHDSMMTASVVYKPRKEWM